MLLRFHKGQMAFFKRFLASYLLILIIPLILASFAYNQAVKVVEQDSIESRLFILRHIRDSVDKHLKDLDETAFNFAIDSKLNRLMAYNQPLEGSPDMFWFYDFSRDLKSRTTINTIFKTSYCIILKNNETIFFNSKTSFGFRDHYTEYLDYNGMDYSEWFKTLFGAYYYKKVIPARKVNVDGIQRSVITYLFTIPISEKLAPEGVIAFLIEEEEIDKLLQAANMGAQGGTFITDEQGRMISGSLNNYHLSPNQFDISGKTEGYSIQQVSGQDMLCIYSHSQFNDWTYVSVLPVKAVMGKVQYVRNTALIVAVAALLIGVLISLYLTNRNTKPFKEVLSTLRDFFSAEKESAQINEYDFLKGSISSLIHDNKMMELSLQRQSSTLRTVFLDKLLKGEFDDRHKMEALISHVGMKFTEKAFTVIILKINRHDALISQSILAELDIFRAVIEGILEKPTGDHCYLQVLNENELALLLNFTADSGGAPTALVDKIIHNISREVASLYPITPVFGVGNVYHDLFDVHYSFIEARQALNFLEDNSVANCSVIWYHQIKKEGGIYYYPNDLEQKLINFAKSGSRELLVNALDKIYDENFRKRVLSSSLKRTLFVDMHATLLKLLEETQLDPDLEKEIDALSTKKPPEEFFQLLEELYQKIGAAAVNHRKSHNAQLKQSIMEFIDANFTDANLSVYLVASRFHLSESYFSQFFKEQTGVTFSNYVETARIKLACRLISEGGLTIDELAGKTGYNSTHSFRRAFKKVMGIVPTAYGDPCQPKSDASPPTGT